MAVYNEVQPAGMFIGKLQYGADLLEELTTVCRRQSISLGRVEAIGAVQKARLGYYDQNRREYNFFEIDEHLEIASLIGNISIRDGEPMVHVHAIFSDLKGKCTAGHLAPGTVIFSCEFVIHACDGPDYRRDYDEQTGLPLWKM